MTNLLLKVATFVAVAGEGDGILDTAYDRFYEVATTILPIVIAVILVVGAFFGISIGIKFAKAEDADARDKAKGQLINLAIGVGVTAVIMIVCFALVKTDVLAGLFPEEAGGSGSGEAAESALRILGL